MVLNYSKHILDEKAQQTLQDQVPDTVNGVAEGELDVLSVDVATTSKTDLDHYLESTEGVSFVGESAALVTGVHNWGRGTTANRPAVIATTAITATVDASTIALAASVIDSAGSPGTARFTFTPGPTMFVGQAVTMDAFPETTYNVLDTITAVGIGFFETSVAYVTDETGGDFTSDSATITATAHGLSDFDIPVISDTTNFDGSYEIYNTLTNTFQINLVGAYPGNESSGNVNLGLASEGDFYFDEDLNTQLIVVDGAYVEQYSGAVSALAFFDGSSQGTAAATTDINYSALAAIEANSQDMSAEITQPQGLFVSKLNPLKLYLGDGDSQTAYEYDLAAPFSVAVAPVFTTNTINPAVNFTDFLLKDDDTEAYFLSFGGDIRSYPLSTPGDLSTAGSQTLINTGLSSVNSVKVVNGGRDAYFTDNAGMILHWQMDPWDWNTLTDTGDSFDTGLVTGNGASFVIRDDARRAILVDGSGNELYDYEFVQPLVAASLQLRNTFTIPGATLNWNEICANPGGTKLLAMSRTADSIHEFDMGLEVKGLSTFDRVSVQSSVSDETPISLMSNTGTNPGDFNIHVGDRDPDGVVTADSAAFYVKDDTTTSQWFINKSNGTGTDWEPVSFVSDLTIEVFSLDDLPAPSGGVITLETGLYIFKGDINFGTNRLDLGGNSIQMVSDNPFHNLVTYEGTGTFISSTELSTFRAFYPGITFILSGDGATFFDMVGTSGLQFSSILFTHPNGGHLGTIQGEVFETITGGRFNLTRTVAFGWLTGFFLNGTDRLYVNNNITESHVNATGSFITTINASDEGKIIDLQCGLLNASASMLNIDPTYDAPLKIIRSLVTGIGTGFQVGTTGTFTAVADASIASTAITSVSDSSGVAQFNHAGTDPSVGETVDLTGFATETTYNTSGVVTVSSAGSFEVSTIAFTATDTGNFTAATVTLTSTAHGLSNLDTLRLETDLATDYDGGFAIFNVQTNTFEVSVIFTVTQTGTWDTSSLNQTHPPILSQTSTGIPDSHFIATAFVNDNSTANGAIVNNTFTDLVFGTAGDALIVGSTMERWKLIDELNGTFEYFGDEEFDGLITFDFTLASSGGTVDFRFKWEHDIGAGFVDLPDPVEGLAAVGSDSQSVTKTFPLKADKGDQIRPQITRNSGTSGITTQYATIYAVQ